MRTQFIDNNSFYGYIDIEQISIGCVFRAWAFCHPPHQEPFLVPLVVPMALLCASVVGSGVQCEKGEKQRSSVTDSKMFSESDFLPCDVELYSHYHLAPL